MSRFVVDGDYGVVSGMLSGKHATGRFGLAAVTVFQPEPARVARYSGILPSSMKPPRSVPTWITSMPPYSTAATSSRRMCPGFRRSAAKTSMSCTFPVAPWTERRLSSPAACLGTAAEPTSPVRSSSTFLPGRFHNLRRAILGPAAEHRRCRVPLRRNNALAWTACIWDASVRALAPHRARRGSGRAGPHPVVAKFIDGVKVGQQELTAGSTAVGRSPPIRRSRLTHLLFGGLADESQEAFVSVQLRDGRLAGAAGHGGGQADAEDSWRRGHQARRRPQSSTLGGNATQAPSPTGPWTPVDNAAQEKPFTIPSTGGTRVIGLD